MKQAEKSLLQRFLLNSKQLHLFFYSSFKNPFVIITILRNTDILWRFGNTKFNIIQLKAIINSQIINTGLIDISKKWRKAIFPAIKIANK